MMLTISQHKVQAEDKAGMGGEEVVAPEIEVIGAEGEIKAAPNQGAPIGAVGTRVEVDTGIDMGREAILEGGIARNANNTIITIKKILFIRLRENDYLGNSKTKRQPSR